MEKGPDLPIRLQWAQSVLNPFTQVCFIIGGVFEDVLYVEQAELVVLNHKEVVLDPIEVVEL